MFVNISRYLNVDINHHFLSTKQNRQFILFINIILVRKK